jgi:SAM-dependent MidA family methyltransferase
MARPVSPTDEVSVMSRAEAILRARTARRPITFAEFMEEALYGEEGYYRRAELPIGEAGDFVTGSSLSPLFGRATGRLLRRLDGVLGRAADFLEAGYGGGAHLASAVDLAGGGPGRRVMAWDRVARRVPAGIAAVAALDEVPEGSVEGLIFSYELFDALPVHRLIGRAGVPPGELYVALGERRAAGWDTGKESIAMDELGAEGEEAGRFEWREGAISEPRLADFLRDPDVELAPGQVADLSPGWAPLYRQLARRLGRGLLVTCDYGFERARLLDPRVRRNGTLACYSGQRVHRNPFVKVGEQDLTAHVDFTALRQAGESEGLATVALTRQALWLAACGIFEDLAETDPETRQQAMVLLDGEGMGEEIRVLVQARGIEAEQVFGPAARAMLR